MTHQIDIQIASQTTLPISNDRLTSWVAVTLDEHYKEPAELTIRLVDSDEMTHLNKTYRKQDKPTNVLAFPSQIPENIALDYPFLGDVIICPTVLQIESVEQDTSLQAHWAHIVIHGVLHLLGYDHIEDSDAKIMQAMEIKLLNHFGFSNPYHQEGH